MVGQTTEERGGDYERVDHPVYYADLDALNGTSKFQVKPQGEKLEK